MVVQQYWEMKLLVWLSRIYQLQLLVPVHQFDKLLSYCIFACLVFVPLTRPYLHDYGEELYNTSPCRLREQALKEPKGWPTTHYSFSGHGRLAELQLPSHFQVRYKYASTVSNFFIYGSLGIWLGY